LPKEFKSNEYKTLGELKAYIWGWTDNILSKSALNYEDPETMRKDKNQNNIMNIYFGIEDYWKFHILNDISKDLRKKKILSKKEKLYN